MVDKTKHILEDEIFGTCLKIGTPEPIIGKLRNKDFTSPFYINVYKAMGKIFKKFGHISCVLLSQEINQLDKLKQIEQSSEGIKELIPSYVAQLRAKTWKKETITALAGRSSTNSEEFRKVLERQLNKFEAFSVDSFNLSQALNEVFDNIEAVKEDILSTGMNDLDTAIGSMYKKKLYIVAGRPSQGKTSLLINIGLNLIKNGKKILVYSAEGGYISYLKRVFSLISKTENMKIWQGSLSENDWSKLLDATNKLSKLPLILSKNERAKFLDVEKEIQYYKPDVVIIDFLQLVSLAGVQGENKNQKLGRYAELLKHYATKYNTCIICASQVNRKVEDRDPPKPNLNSLRDSGEIEQSADCVIGIWYPLFYGKPSPGIELQVLKNRDGPAGRIINLQFNPEFYEVL